METTDLHLVKASQFYKFFCPAGGMEGVWQRQIFAIKQIGGTPVIGWSVEHEKEPPTFFEDTPGLLKEPDVKAMWQIGETAKEAYHMRKGATLKGQRLLHIPLEKEMLREFTLCLLQ